MAYIASSPYITSVALRVSKLSIMSPLRNRFRNASGTLSIHAPARRPILESVEVRA
jgi:hypothetical protein